MRAAGGKFHFQWPVVRRHYDMRFSKDYETAGIPIERATEALMFDMELTVGETPAVPSENTVNHFDPDLIIAASEIEQCIRLETDFERKVVKTLLLHYSCLAMRIFQVLITCHEPKQRLFFKQQCLVILSCSWHDDDTVLFLSQEQDAVESGVKGMCSSNGHIDYDLLVDRLRERQFMVMLVGDHKGGMWTGLSPRHPYLLCFESIASESIEDPIILDPHFKSQFDIQNPTLAYSGIMEALPDAFIGRKERLELLVEILCREMQRSFRMKQRALPPWRGLQAMLLKWKSPSGEILREIGSGCVGSC